MAKDNLSALQKCLDWCKEEGLPLQTPPKATYTSPAELFTIRIEPEIAFLRSGIMIVCQLWNTKNTKLTNDMFQMGFTLMKRELSDPTQMQRVMAMRDQTVNPPKFVTERVMAPAPEADLNAQVTRIENYWLEVNGFVRKGGIIRPHETPPEAPQNHRPPESQ